MVGRYGVEKSGAGSLARFRIPGIDAPHSMRQWANGAGGATFYYQMHRPGHVSGLVNTSNQLVNEYRYTPFGTPVNGYPVQGTPNPLQYKARELDALSGLYYVRNRWYDPQQGRFVSEDPIGLAGGVNQYVYAGANPVLQRDPSGLDPCTPYWVYTAMATQGRLFYVDRYAMYSSACVEQDPISYGLMLQERGRNAMFPFQAPVPHPELPGGFDREYLTLEQFNRVQCVVAGTTPDIQNAVLPRLFGGSVYTGDLSSLGNPPALAAVETHASHLPIIIAGGPFGPLAALGDHTLAQIITHEGRHILQANGTVLPASAFSLMHATWLWQQVFDAVLLEPDARASELSARRPNCSR